MKSKRFCPICKKVTAHLNKAVNYIDWGCLSCDLEEEKIEILASVKMLGHKAIQGSWEREKKIKKARFERDWPEELPLFNQFVKQVEKELYPNTIAIGDYRVSIWWFIAVIGIIFGAIAWNIWKRKKNEKENKE